MVSENVWEWEGRGRNGSGERDKVQTLRRLDSVRWHVGSSEAILVCLGSGDRALGEGCWADP